MIKNPWMVWKVTAAWRWKIDPYRLNSRINAEEAKNTVGFTEEKIERTPLPVGLSGDLWGFEENFIANLLVRND